MSSHDWPKLVAQGRAKDNGVAWSETEQEALAALIEHTGLPRPEVAPYVREGILTSDAYDAAKAKEGKGGKATEHKSRKELVAEAAALGIAVNDAMSDATIAKLVKEGAKNAETAATAAVPAAPDATAPGVAPVAAAVPAAPDATAPATAAPKAAAGKKGTKKK